LGLPVDRRGHRLKVKFLFWSLTRTMPLPVNKRGWNSAVMTQFDGNRSIRGVTFQLDSVYRSIGGVASFLRRSIGGDGFRFLFRPLLLTVPILKTSPFIDPFESFSTPLSHPLESCGGQWNRLWPESSGPILILQYTTIMTIVRRYYSTIFELSNGL
jgi:hypothetical protein